MDVSAFASLLSLSDILDNIKRRHFYGQTRLDKEQIDGFQETVRFMQEFLENLSPGAWRQIDGLVRKIPDLVFVAKDAIDLNVVSQLVGEDDEEPDEGLSAFRQDLSSVVREFEVMKQELVSVKLESMELIPRPSASRNSDALTLKKGYAEGVVGLVGFEEQIKILKEELGGNQRQLKVIPIVGMGGMGKTALARCVYEDRFSVRRFDKRIWCVVSQNNDLKSILQEVVGDKETEEINQLGHKLHQMLFGRRYLVVFDDVWTPEAWKELKAHFRDGNNGSRIIVTTRESNVVRSIGCVAKPVEMEFLGKDQSWELLLKKVFDGNDHPPYLEKVGREIAESCRGLPLSIVAISGLLSKSNMTLEYWEYVAENVSSLVSSEDGGNCLDILSFSYVSMPLYLKPCFVYLGHYKEGSLIRIDNLIQEWSCASFLKPRDGKTADEIGEEHVKELIHRSLVLCELPEFGCKDPSKFRIHDLIRELCLRESQNANLILNPSSFTWFADICPSCSDIGALSFVRPNSSPNGSAPGPCDRCFGSIVHQVRKLNCMKLNRCSICIQEKTEFAGLKLPRSSSDRFLRFQVFDEVIQIGDGNSLRTDLKCPLPLSIFWNVVILEESLGESKSRAPVWSMTQVEKYEIENYGDVRPRLWFRESLILEKLSSLSCRNLNCTRGTVDHVPNLRFLDISYCSRTKDISWYCLENIGCWNQLQELKISEVRLDGMSITYPQSLKVLVLTKCKVFPGHMELIGTLCSLKRLSLLDSDLGDEWRLEGVELMGLEHLCIDGCHDLKWWGANESNFPKLETLVLKSLPRLERIPLDMGNIATLVGIFVSDCSCDGVVESAKRILRSQRRNAANDTLQLYIGYELGLTVLYEDDDEEEQELDDEEEQDQPTKFKL